MKILSLFDGIAGAYEALREIELYPDVYFAAEIDRYAIQIAKKNNPEIVHLGDVSNIKPGEYKNIDLIVGGSPCQDLSCAKRSKKGLQGDKSKLFWEYTRLLKEINPRWFLFENVASMSPGDRDVITKTLGVEPIKICSSLVTAQLRKRYYWTNIPGVKQPKDKNICLESVLQGGTTEKKKSYCITATYNRACVVDYLKHSQRQMVIEDNELRKLTPVECERLQGFRDGYTYGVPDVERYKMIGNSFTVPVISHILSFIPGINQC